MSKLTEWLRSLVGLTKVDEDAIVADGEAAISRVFERLGDHLEAEMAAFQDRLTSAVPITVGDTDLPAVTREEAIEILMADRGRAWLLEHAIVNQCGTRKELARVNKTDLATLIVDAK